MQLPLPLSFHDILLHFSQLTLRLVSSVFMHTKTNSICSPHTSMHGYIMCIHFCMCLTVPVLKRFCMRTEMLKAFLAGGFKCRLLRPPNSEMVPFCLRRQFAVRMYLLFVNFLFKLPYQLTVTFEWNSLPVTFYFN